MCRVIDASSKDNKHENGYPVTEIVAITKNRKQPLSVYSNVYSTKSKNFKSANIETDKALDRIYNSFGNLGTVVMDRGYDDGKRMNYFIEKDWNFIIRGTKQRNINYQNKTYKQDNFFDKYKGKINVKVHLKNKVISAKCSYFKVRLNNVKKQVYMVVVYYKTGTSHFYTNRRITNKNECIKVIADYYKRWKIEEYFKFKKSEFGFEKFRVRSLEKINSLNTLLTMSLNTIGTQVEKESKLANTIEYLSKSIKVKVYFRYYRIANGIYILFKYLKTGIRNMLTKIRSKEKQLSLFSDFFDMS